MSTIARWQRISVLTALAAMAAWLAWQWPQSPSRAVLGALVPLAIFALVMAAQFALMHAVNGAQHGFMPAPRATLREVLAAWVAEVRVALAVFTWRQPFRHASIPDWLPEPPVRGAEVPRGVVLVHGFMCNRGFWLPWLPRLRTLGHAHVAVNLEPPLASIDRYAAAIEDAVQRVTAATGGQAPVLLCHSMGGLAARAWLRQYHPDADARVHRIITLGSPHRGTWLGQFSRAANGRQMRLAGQWLAALERDEPPGRTALFTCWYSNCDNIVFPAGTATLPGADNRFAAGLAHVQMAFDPAVMQACLDEIGQEADLK